MFDRTKQHLKDHKELYIGIGIGVVATGTLLIIRETISQPISVAIGDAASGAIGVAGKKVVMNFVSFISSNRQGSPSWVVRCLETDEIFTSQRSASNAYEFVSGTSVRASEWNSRAY